MPSYHHVDRIVLQWGKELGFIKIGLSKRSDLGLNPPKHFLLQIFTRHSVNQGFLMGVKSRQCFDGGGGN